MPICQNIQINYNGGIYGNGTEADLAIDEVVGVSHANCVTSYGGQIVDMTGDWNWKEGVGGKISEYDAIIKESAKRLNLDWRLCAALCYTESRFNPKAYNPSGAKGMWQIIFWSENAPSGCKDNSYAYDPEKSTLGFENIMRKHLNRNSKAATRNDQIALAIQCYHDGSLGSDRPSPYWGNRCPGKYGKTEESYQYVPKIIKKYKEYCS